VAEILLVTPDDPAPKILTQCGKVTFIDVGKGEYIQGKKRVNKQQRLNTLQRLSSKAFVFSPVLRAGVPTPGIPS
jgi:hypothetical protein